MFYSIMNEDASEYRLFLAAVPDPATAERIFQMANVLKHAYGFTGELIEPERLHVSLFFLGGLPGELVDTTCMALADTRMPPFDAVFDRSVSFRGRVGNRPFVLIGDNGPSPLKSFRQMLGTVLAQNGLRRRANTNFTPHVTLLYDARAVEEHPVAPISWTVNEFVLIRSQRGHQHLRRWPMREESRPLTPAASPRQSASQNLPLF
jgi:2'-5' RNA ligase